MEIPVYPDFTEVDLSHRRIVNDFFTRHPVEASEYTFTNIFSFRLAYNFKLSLLNDNLIIFKDTEPVSIFCPIGESGIENILKEIFDFMSNINEKPYLERVPKSFVRDYLTGDTNFLVDEDRNQFDYLYSVKELIELKGNKFHDKKNHVNQFRRQYRYEYLSLTPDLIDECLEFEDYWCMKKDCGKYPGLEKERCAILEMLNNFGSLNAKGGVIRVDGKIAALTIGEKMMQDMFVIHVEKANPDIQGLYQVINQEFLIHEAGDCRFVNREQDMGVPGLRNAKISYNPVKFIKKYTARKKWA
jgi:hypothetical protein